MTCRHERTSRLHTGPPFVLVPSVEFCLDCHRASDEPDFTPRTEGATMSDADTLVKFAAVAADLATSTGHPYREIYESLVEALGWVAEAERRGAEKGMDLVALKRLQELAWDAGWRTGWDDCWDKRKQQPNPYRVGDDQ